MLKYCKEITLARVIFVSTLEYSWIATNAEPSVVLKNNKEFFSANMDKTIEDVKEKIKQTKDECVFAENFDFTELVEIVEKEKEKFLKWYTMEILTSPNHMQLVDKKVEEFNQTARKIKAFLKNFVVETSSDIDVSAIESIIKSLPKGSENLKRQLEKMREYYAKVEVILSGGEVDWHTLELLIKSAPKGAEKLRRKLEDIRKYFLKAEEMLTNEKVSKEELVAFFETIPMGLRVLRNKVSNAILRLEMPQQQRHMERVELQQKEEKLKERIEFLKRKAKQYYAKLEKVDAAVAQETKELMDELEEENEIGRVELLTEELKFRYAKAKEQYLRTQLLKDEILAIYKTLEDEQLRKIAESLLSRETLNEADYEHFVRLVNLSVLGKRSQVQDVKEKLISLISEELQKNGYKSVDEDLMERLERGEVVELQSPFGEDYVIRMKIDGETVAIRFIRYVESEDAISEYEREKDISIGKKWCEMSKHIRDVLAQNGIFLETKHRIEPEEKFYYEVRKKEDMVMKKKEEGKQKTRRNQVGYQ